MWPVNAGAQTANMLEFSNLQSFFSYKTYVNNAQLKSVYPTDFFCHGSILLNLTEVHFYISTEPQCVDLTPECALGSKSK